MPQDKNYWQSPQLFWDALKAYMNPLGFLFKTDPLTNDDAIMRILKEKEPKDNPDIKPKTEDPPQVIMPPPTVIYDVTNNVYNRITVNIDIKLPERILPENINPPTGGGGGSTNTQTTYTSEVKSSLANRKFGCMLCKPFYGQAIDWCELTEAETFYTDLASAMEADITTAEAKITDPNEPDDYVMPLLAGALVSVNSATNPVMVIGLNQLYAISKYYTNRSMGVSSLPVTGMFTNLGVKTTQCEIDNQVTTESDFPVKYGFMSDDCSVPITFFSDIDGYKRDQLQLIFQSVDDKRRKRSITMPSVGDIDTIDPTTAGIPTLPFGGTLIEIWHDLKNVEGHVQPVQKSKFYSNYETKEQIETFVYTTYQQWLTLLCKDVEIKTYQVIIQDETKEEKYHKGDYKPYRAVYMGWDQEKLKWCNKKAWYLPDPANP